MPSGGHNRKTTAELKGSGGYRAGRHGDRIDTSPTKGTPQYKGRLTKQQRQIWDSVIAQVPAAALGEVDQASLIELVETYGAMVKARKAMAKDIVGKEARIAYCNMFDRWLKLAQEFGCTPRSRAAIKVPQKTEESQNPITELLSRFQGVN